MDIKKTTYYGSIVFIMLTLTACPNRYSDSCVNQNITTLNQPDLIQVYPLQETYHIGDVLTYEVVIDSESDFFDEPVDIYEYSHATELLLGGTELHTLLLNNYTIVEGDLREISESEIPFLIYYLNRNVYSFKCVIEFTQTGEYALHNGFRLVFEGDDYCRLVKIDRTDMLGIPQEEGWFNFEVVE